ncbi:enoyl-CoA hydratase/isomerase family protein [Paracoccus caeni]|uniref:Enoyl-CoA hydratase/isomerase family protein n=1 Tax=Paracoccus caeni TaxID=657651 RepID=A0A934VTY5_9RHOB|nr:enoyl-CoA hydratase/isomerase family protein [Paracoccus caeni]MBK4215236.1 enoyl-CoA hydratase/isomerase family protein [Paracoccus caeni]
MSAVHLSQADGIATLQLDNPAKLNAFTPSMLDDLARHLEVIDADPRIVAVKLTSVGDRAFCAGADIAAWSGYAPDEFARIWVRTGHRVFDRLARLSKPTIAVLQAHAFGGGLELAAACDIRVIAPQATIALPETHIGIVPGWSGTQRLSRLLPEPALREMALFGRRIDAARAFSFGFVAEVADDADGSANGIADKLKETSPRATEIAKYMINAAVNEDAAAMIEALGSGMIAASADRAEGVASFTQKRKPKFDGR